MKKVQMIASKIVNFIMILVIAAILFCMYCIFSVKVLGRQYVNIFGYSIFEVVTGSMKDEINIGDAVLVKINDKYQEGDVITYKAGDDFITHRVVSMKDNYVITKGDANNVNDNPIDQEMILGRVIKVIPKLGVWKKVLVTPKVIILILMTLFIFSILFSYDGSAIKIISSKKAQKEIDEQVSNEVDKQVARINKKRKYSKKVLDATQIISLDDIKEELGKQEKVSNKTNSKKKKLEVTQVIDISEIKKNL